MTETLEKELNCKPVRHILELILRDQCGEQIHYCQTGRMEEVKNMEWVM